MNRTVLRSRENLYDLRIFEPDGGKVIAHRCAQLLFVLLINFVATVLVIEENQRLLFVFLLLRRHVMFSCVDNVLHSCLYNKNPLSPIR